MTYSFVKSAFIAAFLLGDPVYADSETQTVLPANPAEHHTRCSDNTEFVSRYCAELRRAILARTQDCMASAPATSQGYRAKYLLCTAQINRDFGASGG